ncbi:hypothetical protein HHX47_DHR6000236 [Lentinula edodes]|nr:hypothetical protein HHX47_DHR6000236 [Lentinula edodes]
MPPERTLNRRMRNTAKNPTTDLTSSSLSSPRCPPNTPSTRRNGNHSRKRQEAQATSDAEDSGNPSASRLLDHSRQTTDDWYKSLNTKKGYAGYVKSGKKWILEWAGKARTDLDGQSATDTEGLTYGFESISKYTPMALRLLTAYKCDHQGNKFSTAEGIRSAFKDYFERVLGCQGEFWKFNSHSDEWEGNPVFETDYRAYYESLKNRENRTSTSTQALPMLPADLQVLFDFLDSPEGCKHFTLTQRLYFKAFASTAFNLWTRNDELIHFMFKDLKLAQISDGGTSYIEFRLIFRKTNRDPNKGIASTGQLKFGESTSRTGVENLLENIVDASGLMQGRRGKFTTHCFRRGGAQYRFMWADRKWSLKAVKWWGGWSSNENVGTIMRYLLDELMAYEEGFTDIMMPDRALERHETFMGTQDVGKGISRNDILSLEYRMMQKLEDIAKTWSVTPPASPSPNQRASSSVAATPTPSQPQATNSLTAGAVLPTSLHTPARLRPSRIPEVNSLDDVVRYWEKGDSERGLVTPLKDWGRLFDSKDYKSEAVKLSNIRFVYEEFSGPCGGSYDTFELSFPDLRSRYTKLLRAVRNARKARGEAKSRKRH